MSTPSDPVPAPPARIAVRVAARATGRARVAQGAGVREIACDVAMRWLWDYVDARLPGAPRAAFEAHLATCAACPTHVAFARALQRALADVPAPMSEGADGADAARTTGLRARVQEVLAEMKHLADG